MVKYTGSLNTNKVSCTRRNGRVLHVLDSLVSSSGVASVVMHYVCGIPNIEQDIAIYGQCDLELEKKVNSCGGNVYKLPSITQSLGMQFSSEFSQLLQTHPYSVVHGHLINSAFIYLREAKQLDVPYRIIHAHSATSADTFLKKVRNDILAQGLPLWATHYIATSQTAAINTYGKKHAIIIHNGIDSQRFRFDIDIRRKVRQELGIFDDTLCVGHVGRFAKLKNHTFLLEVFWELQKKAKCELILVGDGPLENKIKSMVMGDNVHFLGARHDVERLYQAFDVFLLPSLSEGFGLVAVEAQCSGLGCVISTAVPSIIKCSDNIRFLPLGDSKSWAMVALELSSLTRVDGVAGVNVAQLDISNACIKMLNIYNSMI